MKFIFPTPVVWDGNESRYLQRDGARYAEECRRRGHEGVKIILDDGTVPNKPSSPLLESATLAQWKDPSYWRSTKADFCLLYAGLATRSEPVARAIHEAGIPVVAIQDTAFGILSPSKHVFLTFQKDYFIGRNTRVPVFAFAYAVAKRFYSILFPHTKRIRSFLSWFDGIAVSNELAFENTCFWLRNNGLSRLANHTLLFPLCVRDSLAIAKESPPKKKQVLSVALDWTLPVKGGSLLIDTLSVFLSRRPDYSALIIGKGSDGIADKIREKAPSVGTRISSLSAMDSTKLVPYYAESEILFVPSGSEGGPTVAYEALCCGCSLIVAPPLIQWNSLQMLHSGRIAKQRTAASCCAALQAEAADWENGVRDAGRISAVWSEKCHISKIFDKLLQFKASL